MGGIFARFNLPSWLVLAPPPSPCFPHPHLLLTHPPLLRLHRCLPAATAPLGFTKGLGPSPLSGVLVQALRKMARGPGWAARFQHCNWLLCAAHHLLFLGRGVFLLFHPAASPLHGASFAGQWQG